MATKHLSVDTKVLMRKTKNIRSKEIFGERVTKIEPNYFTQKWVGLVEEIKTAADPASKTNAIKRLNFLKALAYAVAGDHTHEVCDIRGKQVADPLTGAKVRSGSHVKISSWKQPMDLDTYDMIKTALRQGWRI